MRLRVLCCLHIHLLFLLPGCGTSERASLDTTSFESGSCALDSTWRRAPDLTAITVRRAQTELFAVAGVAAHGDHVFVFDAGGPTIYAFDARSLTVEGRFGREGRGPGEYGREGQHPGVRHRRLVDAGGYLAVLDLPKGRVHAVDYDGRNPRSLQSSITRLRASILDGRLYAHGDTVFMGSGYFTTQRPTEEGLFSVVAAFGDSVWTVGSIPMQNLPRTRGGAMVGRSEALPLWAVQGDCLYLNNGHDLIVTRVQRSLGVVDSIALQVPSDMELGEPFDRDRYASLGMADWPDPVLLRRITDLSIDPAGGIWLQLVPAQFTPGRALVAYLAPGQPPVVSVLPFFPRAFGADGALYGVQLDPMGSPWLVKLELL